MEKKISEYWNKHTVTTFDFKKALQDNRLDKVHRDFLKKIEIKNNIFYYNGQISGIGLCHELLKE
jgi:hypothetical protein